MFKRISSYIALHAAFVSALFPSWGWATLSEYESKILQIRSNKVEDYDTLPDLLRQDSLPIQYEKIRLVHKLPSIDQKYQSIPVKEVYLSTQALSTHGGYIIDRLVVPETSSFHKIIRHVGSSWLIIKEWIGDVDQLDLRGQVRIERFRGRINQVNVIGPESIIEIQDENASIGLLRMPYRGSKVYVSSVNSIQEIQNEGELLSQNALDFSHMLPSQLRQLGTIKSEKELIFHLRDSNAFEFLKQYYTTFFFSSALHITADHLQMLEDLDMRKMPLTLHLHSFLNEFILKTASLSLQTLTFQNGTSNDTMGQMEVYGRLDLTAEDTIDNRFGKIKAARNAKIEGKKGVLNGEGEEDHESIFDFTKGADPSQADWWAYLGWRFNDLFKQSKIKRKKPNSALLSSNETLEIRSSYIDNNFGSVYGHQRVHLHSDQDILNSGGQICSSGHIDIESQNFLGETLKNKILVNFNFDLGCSWSQEAGRGVVPTSYNSSFNADLYASYFETNGGSVKSMNGNISFLCEKCHIIGAQVLAKEHLKINGKVRHNLAELCDDPHIIIKTDEESYGGTNPGFKPIILSRINSIVQAGELVSIDTEGLIISGTVNAPNVQIKASLMEMYGQYLTVMPSQNAVVVDLGRMALDQAQKGGMYHLAGASLVPPLLQEEAVSIQSQSSSAVTSSSSSRIPKVRIVQNHPHLQKQAQRSSEEETYVISASQKLSDSSDASLIFNPQVQFSTYPSVSSNFLSAACLEYSFMDMCAKVLSGLNIYGQSGSSLIQYFHARGKQAERLLSDQGIDVHSESQMQKFAENFGGFLYYQPLIVSYTDTNGIERETTVQSPFVLITEKMIKDAAQQSIASVIGQRLDIDVDQLIMSDSVIASQTEYQAPSIVRPSSGSHTHIMIQRDFEAESSKIHSTGTTHLHVGGNSKMTTKTSGAKVSSTSSDRLEHASQISGDERLNMRVEGNEQLGHVVFQSQNEIQRTVLGDSINVPDRVERHETHYHGDTTISHLYINHYSKIVNAPRVQELFGSDVVMTNIKYDVQELDITIAGNLALTTANDIQETTVRTEDDGWFSTSISQTTHGSSSSMGNRMNATQKLSLKVLGQDVYLQQLDIQSKVAEIYAPFARILFAQGVHQTWYSSFESDSSWIWNSGSMAQSQHQTYTSSRSNTRIKVTADKVIFERTLDTGNQRRSFSFQDIQQKLLENVDGPLEKFLSKLDIESGKPIDSIALKELYESTSDSYSRPGAGLMIAVGIAATYLTAGAASYAGGYFAGSAGMTETVAATTATTSTTLANSGMLAGMASATTSSTATLATGTTLTLSTAGSMTAAMVSAGITAFSATAATSLLTSQGNILEASKSLFSKQTLKSMTRSIFAAAALYGLAATANVGVNHAQASSRATSTFQASQNTTQQTLRSAQMLEHSRTVALNFGANVATGLAFGDSLNTALNHSGVHAVAGGVSGMTGDQLFTSRLNDVEQMMVQSSMAAVIAGGLSSSDRSKTALIAYVSSLFSHLYMTQVCPNTVRVSEISRNATLVEVPDAYLMEKSRVFAEISTALFSGLAKLDSSQIQAVGSGVSLGLDQHQRRAQRNIQHGLDLSRAMVQSNLKADRQAELENIRRARQQKAKEEAEKKAPTQQASSVSHQNETSSSSSGRNLFLSVSSFHSRDLMSEEKISFLQTQDQRTGLSLDFNAMQHFTGDIRSLTPRSRSAFIEYREISHLMSGPTIRTHGMPGDDGSLYDPEFEAQQAYVGKQHELAEQFKQNKREGRTLSGYEKSVIEHQKQLRNSALTDVARTTAYATAGVLTGGTSIAARTAFSTAGVVSGALGAANDHDFHVNSTQALTDMTVGGVLEGVANTGVISAITGGASLYAYGKVTDNERMQNEGVGIPVGGAAGLVASRAAQFKGSSVVNLTPATQVKKGVTITNGMTNRVPANLSRPLTEPSSQAMRMTGTGGVSVSGGGNSTTSNFVKDRAQFFADKPIMGAKGPQTTASTSTIRGGSSVVGNTSTSSSSANALTGGREILDSQHLLTNQHGRYVSGQAFISKPLPRSEKLLSGTHGNAGFVPDEIAKMMEGRTFRDFDHFREEFWKSVSQSSYVSEFGSRNIDRMARGFAPNTHYSQQLGERISYELHHITPINKGGAVFDLSNIAVVTPKYHKEVLEKSYHYARK